jgi:hypothetical protein
MLPYAFSSVIRNIFITLSTEIPENQSVRRSTVYSTINNRSEVHNGIDLTTTPQNDDWLNNCNSFFKGKIVLTEKSIKIITEGLQKYKTDTTDTKDKIKNLITCIIVFCKDLFKQYNYDDKYYKEAEALIIEYFVTDPIYDYEKQRETYYERLRKSEDAIKDQLQKQNSIVIMKALSESQVFRQEGYVCVSTVIHVPRFIQQCDKSEKNEKICSTDCNNEKNIKPGCLLNSYAYILSIIEQIGFMLRYVILSKIKNIDILDYEIKKKIEKYEGRLGHALSQIHQQQTKGGKRKQKHTKKNKKTKSKKSKKNRKRTRKNKHIHI